MSTRFGFRSSLSDDSGEVVVQTRISSFRRRRRRRRKGRTTESRRRGRRRKFFRRCFRTITVQRRQRRFFIRFRRRTIRMSTKGLTNSKRRRGRRRRNTFVQRRISFRNHRFTPSKTNIDDLFNRERDAFITSMDLSVSSTDERLKREREGQHCHPQANNKKIHLERIRPNRDEEALKHKDIDRCSKIRMETRRTFASTRKRKRRIQWTTNRCDHFQR